MFAVVGFKSPSRGAGSRRAPALFRALLGAVLLLFLLPPAASRAATGWSLDPTVSTLTYQSVKKGTVVETNKIRNISGTLSPEGDAKLSFDLNSVDTGVDLRNVRMRFLFFETFQYPNAEITAKVDPAAFADLPNKRRMVVPLPFTLSLHGVQKELKADVVVTMVSDAMVSVASNAPVAVNAADYGLLPNIEKLQQAANVSSIVPTASVSFDLVFRAGAAPAQPVQVVAATQTDAGPVATDASKTSFSDDECLNRFQVLSRTGAIYFRTASARLDPKSRPLIEEVVGVISKCPDLKVEVSGHTDSDGSPPANQALSERRAEAVADALRAAGIPAVQISAAGYGEDKPIAPNDTAKNKALNRRIEFSATKLN
jgi:outer membrane protein OmpA-like peptidoglycan-associated protein